MSNKEDQPLYLVTGAAGRIGSVGFKIVQFLREKNLSVRAMVREYDERSDALEKLGAEIVKGDLTVLSDVHRAMNGCKRVYFGMAVSENYLEAALLFAAVAKHYNVEVVVNISQMTVSQMNINETTDSRQQRFHWLVEQAFNWSGLPVVHLRATMFMEHPLFTIFARESILKNGEIRLPFKDGYTSPIASIDVARVAFEVLYSPEKHIGKVYELTGRESQSMIDIAKIFSKVLNREILYVDMPFDEWNQNELIKFNFPEHLKNHFRTMAKLHSDNRYNRISDDVEKVTGFKPTSIEDWIRQNIQLFQ